MDITVIIAANGPDKQGVLHQLAEQIHANHGHWQTSKITTLDGHFSALIRVTINEDDLPVLQTALASLPMIHAQIATAELSDEQTQYRWVIECEDSPALTHDIATVLANHGANIEHFDSHHIHIPDSGQTAFCASLKINGGSNLDMAQVQKELQQQYKHLLIRTENEH